MTKFLSLLAIAALLLSVSSAEAAKKKPVTGASATVQNGSGHQKFSYGLRGRAKGSAMAGCKMAGRC